MCEDMDKASTTPSFIVQLCIDLSPVDFNVKFSLVCIENQSGEIWTTDCILKNKTQKAP